MDGIAERAARSGVEARYVDAFGAWRNVPAESLARILDAVGKPDAATSRMLPSTIVAHQGRDRPVSLSGVPADGRVIWTISQGTNVIAQGTDAPIALAGDLPVGTFRLRVRVVLPERVLDESAVLVVAPERAYQGEHDKPVWALAVQLYGVRSRRNWGHGDFTDLYRLLELAADLGAAGIGLNPLHALSDDRPEQASPYSPNSRLFLNPLYIDVGAVAEFPGVREAGLEAEIKRLRQKDYVDYSGVATVKGKGLRLAYAAFRRRATPDRRHSFKAFRSRAGPGLARFAAFEALRHHLSGVWWDWPTRWRTPDDRALAAIRAREPEEFEFVEFVQWIADEQLGACAAKARALKLPIGLYIDVAVGVDAGGADAWSEQTAILNRLSVGAPPDPLNTSGQNWGVAGFNPSGIVEREFEPFRQILKSAMQHAGAIRLDHVLGLKRLFLIPHGMKPDNGAYVGLPFDALLALVAQESVANRCIVIGEDLGTVPENFRDRLADCGIWSYRVMMFERAADGSFHTPDRYTAASLVTFNTHDLPTLAGWLSGHDLAVKRALAIDPGESVADRSAAIQALHVALARRDMKTIDVISVAKYLAATPSRLLVLSMEDALGMEEQVNIPGTIDEHPNWRRRLPVVLEDLPKSKTLWMLARAMTEAGRSAVTDTKGSAKRTPARSRPR